MKDPKVGDTVSIHGFKCKVVGIGECDEDGCNKVTLTIIDPVGEEDSVHLEDCDA